MSAPNIRVGQVALDPYNKVLYYRKLTGEMVSTSLDWLLNGTDYTKMVTGNEVTISNDLIVNGNLTVNGTTTTINAEQVFIEDNILILNSTATGAPTHNAGVEIERGDEANVQLLWNESQNKWQFTNDGVTYYDINSIIEDSVTLGFHTVGDYIKNLVAGTGVTVTNNSGEGATPTISIGQPVNTNSVVTFSLVNANLMGNVTGNLTGNVTGNVSGQVSDITNHGINQLNDVDATPSSGQFLKWNGSSWVNDYIDLTIDIVGGYVKNLVAGTGITVTNNSGEGATPTIANAGVLSVNGNTGVITGIVTTGDTGTVTSTMIADGTIVNADINNSAAIAHSKLANATAGQVLLGTTTTGVITATTVSGDVTINGAGVTAITSGVIIDSDISASAAISHSKLASLTSGNILVGSATNVPTSVAVSGDITINSSGVTAISSGVIINTDISGTAAIAHSKLANATPGQVLLGTTTSGVITATTLSGDVTVDGAGVTSISSGVIVNADINASAAIAISKLASGTSGQVILANASGVPTYTSLTGDIVVSNAGVTAISSGVIIDSDINSSAAITISKLASGSSGQIILANGSGVPTYTTVSGDIAISNTGVVTIQPNSVALGTDTTGNYVASLVAGTGVTLANNTGEDATPTISIGQSVGTTDTVTFNTVNANLVGNVTGTVSSISNHSIDNLSDVAISGAANGDFLRYNGSNWINDPVNLSTDTVGDYVAKLAAGTGIAITNNSGEAATPNIALNANLDDLLDTTITSAANGQFLQYNGSAWVNSTYPTSEPGGHENKANSTVSFNEGTRVFSIAPVSSSHTVWCKGIKYVKSSTENVTITNTSGLHYIYYNGSAVLSEKTTYFDLENDVPVAYVYWNATDSKAYFFADERHGIVLDWQTHEYLHRTRGAAIANGFGANNYTTSGTGSSNADAQIDIADGTFYDEDLAVSIIHSASPVANTWQQRLQSGAYIPVFYKSGSVWKKDVATQFPLKQGTFRPQYNLNTGGTWSTVDVTNNQFGISWILATNNLNEPVIAVLGQNTYSDKGSAEASFYQDMDLSGFPIYEFRALYKIIYECKDTYSNTPKAALRSVIDQRTTVATSGGFTNTPVSDHGSMTGLQDDDHPQYVHTTINRTISATPTFSSGLISNSVVNTKRFILNGIEIESATPADTNVLKYNAALNKYIPGVASTVASLDDLTDVIITSPATPNQVIKYNGTNWVNGEIPSSLSGSTYSHNIGNGIDTVYTITHNLSTRDVYVAFTESSAPYGAVYTQWEATSLNAITAYFDSPPSAASVRVNIYAAVSGLPTVIESGTLDDLTDVVITSPVTNQFLRYGGSGWGNSTMQASYLSDGTTGTGTIVLSNSPTLVTPTLGVASATSINKLTITAPATSATLTIADGKILTASNTLTFTGTDSSSISFGTGGTVVYTSNKLSALSATTSSELAGVISDETGTGALVFGTSPTIATPVLTLSTVSSTTDARISWDSTNKKIQVGNGTTTIDFASGTLVTNVATITGSPLKYTAVLADKDKLVEMSNAAANQFEIPTNTTAAFPIGTQITVLQTGAGQTTIVGAVGVTVNATPGLKLRAQWSSVTLIKRNTDTWVALGDLQA